jgi:hypothetical protein
MGRRGASSSTDRSVAEPRSRRGNSRQAGRQVAQARVRVDDVAIIRHGSCHPTKQSHLAATEVNATCPQVIDDLSHPIPVLERELDAIEMYIGPLLDKMLQRME